MSFLLPLIIQGPGHKLNSQVSRKVKVNYDVHVQLFIEPQLFFLSKIHKKHNFKIMAKSLYAHRDASSKSKLSKFLINFKSSCIKDFVVIFPTFFFCKEFYRFIALASSWTGHFSILSKLYQQYLMYLCANS